LIKQITTLKFNIKQNTDIAL